ncbi:MAG: radical SAM protein [Candidatus Aenigmarchaeota archaeon]|nr:radical SAM protein [Candidatus Aenigmarchaeota archaeon]
MKVSEIKCNSYLTKTNLPDADYVINPYIGCQGACVYCYARFMKRFTGHKEEWGKFVDVKVNCPEKLEKEIKRAKKGRIFFSSVCDPYQPLEKKYKLTRRVLEILSNYDFFVAVQTKFSLVLRDIDILKKLGNNVAVGFTITSLDENVRKRFEPFSSPVKDKINALKKLHKEGIATYVFVGPIFPHFTDLPKIFEKLYKFVDDFEFENLNIRGANWIGVEKVLKKYYPDMLPKWKDIFFTEKRREFDEKCKKEIKALGRKYNKTVKIFFEHGGKYD